MTEQALDELLVAFEDGTFPKSSWNHAAHLAVAGCYLTAFPADEALERMRSGVMRYNTSVGTLNGPDSGYHETLTRFWIEVGRRFLETLPKSMGRAERVTALVDAYSGRRDLFKDYWSFDVVKSREARAGWIAPDRKNL